MFKQFIGHLKMENSNKLSDWIPLITKLVWPLIIIVSLVVFHQQATEIYNVVLKSIKSGRSVEIGGFLKLGNAATKTQISDLAFENISIKGIGGSGGVVRKSSGSHLVTLQQEIRDNPLKTIDTLLLPDNIKYSVDLLKQYIGTLGLKFVVFQQGGQFDGWISSSTFVAQLPAQSITLDYDQLKSSVVGINQQTVSPELSAKKVLEKMQSLHIDSIPVVDAKQRWLFFANRGEILAGLITTMILQEKN
ncbi:MAG: hypothetical protein ACI8Z9_001220 [Paraglaciecola sp.]